MKEPHYLLRRLAFNAPEELLITREQYESLLTSRNCLTELTSFEEKFFAICENYRKVERVIFDITINELLYSSVQVPEIFANGALFSREVASFLSVVRLYLDTAETHADEITKGKIGATAVKALLSGQYDSSFYYRVMDAIRNHVQHRAFPVHSASYGGGWDKDGKEKTYRAEFFFEVAQVKDDGKFKASTLEEVEKFGGKINLKACVRQYFSDLCELHIRFRELFSESKIFAERNIKYWREKWESNSASPSLVGVGAFKYNGEYIDNDAQRIFIGPQIDEYRESLEAKTAILTKMVCRKICLYSVHESK